MKKNGLLFGLVIALTALNFQAFAAGETETDGTVTETAKSVANDKYVIFAEDFQGMKEYNNTIGDYNKDDNISVPTGWLDARALPFKKPADGVQGNEYTDYWNMNDLHIFMSENNHNSWTRGSIHMQDNAGGIEGNIALSLSTSQNGAAYNSGTGAGASQGGYVKYFPNGVATGNFTLEFDVLVNNGGSWALGLIPYDNYDAAITYGTYGGSTSNPTSNFAGNRTGEWGNGRNLTTRAQFSYVIGQMTSDDKLYLPTGVGKAYNTTNFTPLKDGDGNAVTLTNDLADDDYTKTAFNHIKMEFDLYGGVHKVTVTDIAKGTENTYNWTDATPGRFEKGVMGITLQKCNDGSSVSGARVLFDNIEVYKNNAYFIEQDFLGYTKDKQVPGGWYMSGDQLAKKASIANMAYNNARVGSTAGPSGEDGDYAFKINAANGNPQENIFMSLFTRPAYGGHPISVEFDLKSSKDTSWQLHQIDQEYIFAMKGYNYDGGAEQQDATNSGLMYYASIGGRTFSANNAILGYSGWNGTKDIAANQLMSAQTGVSGNTYRTGDKTGKGLDITYGGASAWAYSEGVNLKNESGGDFSYDKAEEQWNHYRVTIVPKANGSGTDYEIAIWPSGMTEYEANASEDPNKAPSYGYASSNRNSIAKPMCGIGFLALSDQSTTTGNIEIDNIKVYEASARVDEDVTYYDEVTNYNNASITGVFVEYADGTVAPLNNNDVISRAAKRLNVRFSEPVAMRAGTEVNQILNRCMTSTAAGTADVSEWTEDQKQYFNVFDSVDEAIKLTRNYSAAERNIATLPKLKTYLAANRYSYYIELDDEMFTANKEYVLTVSPNITFKNSAYSMLDKGMELHFGTNLLDDEKGYEYNKISVVKASDHTAITTFDELKQELDANDNKLTVLINGANTLDKNVTLKLIAAQYTGSGSLLESMQLSDAVLEPGFVKNQVCTITLNPDVISGDAGMDMLRCFLWKFDTYTPISAKVEIGK